MNALEHFKMSNEYYEKKERLQKMDCERYQNLSEKKSANMLANYRMKMKKT